jgi:hypothetical protein
MPDHGRHGTNAARAPRRWVRHCPWSAGHGARRGLAGCGEYLAGAPRLARTAARLTSKASRASSQPNLGPRSAHPYRLSDPDPPSAQEKLSWAAFSARRSVSGPDRLLLVIEGGKNAG